MRLRAFASCLAPLACVLVVSGCQRDDMWQQPRGRGQAPAPFFDDNTLMRDPVEGTVARGQLREDDHFYRGTVGGQPADTFPFEMTREVLERGRERFNIYCAPCHGRSGDGMGMIVQRGFRQPPALYVERLRNASPGYLYDVLVNGYDPEEPIVTGDLIVGEGDMVHPVIAKKMPVEDRWSIIGYIRVLQRSRSATMADVPAEERQRLLEMPEGVR